VSAMLTEQRSEYFTARARLQGDRGTESRAQAEKRGATRAFRVDNVAAAGLCGGRMAVSSDKKPLRALPKMPTLYATWQIAWKS